MDAGSCPNRPRNRSRVGTGHSGDIRMRHVTRTDLASITPAHGSEQPVRVHQPPRLNRLKGVGRMRVVVAGLDRPPENHLRGVVVLMSPKLIDDGSSVHTFPEQRNVPEGMYA